MTAKQAAQLLQSGHAAQALGIARTALTAQPEDPALIDLTARAAIALKRNGEALELLKRQRRLFDQRKVRPRAWYDLGLLFRAIGALESAEDALARAAHMRRDIPIPAVAHAQVLLELGRAEQAREVAAQAFAVAVDNARALSDIAAVLYQSGALEKTCEVYSRCAVLEPGWSFVYNNWAMSLMQLGDPQGAHAVSERWLAQMPGHIEALAFKAVSLSECDDPQAAALLDFDRFVMRSTIDVPPGYHSLAAFNAALEAHVLAHPTLATPAEGHPTYHDPHLKISGNILGEDAGPMAELEVAMRTAVDAYFRALGTDASHPFVHHRPRSCDLTGWAAVLDRQGNQHPHIHLDGYLSGCYYVRVPAEVRNQNIGANQAIAGGFEVGRPPDELRCKREPRVCAIKPEPGLMVLFPAYMYHRTIPFRSSEQRISVAFDVLPAAGGTA